MKPEYLLAPRDGLKDTRPALVDDSLSAAAIIVHNTLRPKMSATAHC